MEDFEEGFKATPEKKKIVSKDSKLCLSPMLLEQPKLQNFRSQQFTFDNLITNFASKLEWVI